MNIEDQSVLLSSMAILKKSLNRILSSNGQLKDFSFSQLKNTIVKLGELRQSKYATCPPEYLAIGNLFLKGQVKDLDTRTLRNLCWEPSIATDLLFVNYSIKNSDQLTARSIQGLIRSYHAKWSQKINDNGYVDQLQKLLLTYNGSNAVLKFWQHNVKAVIPNKDNHQLSESFFSEYFKNNVSIIEFCQAWALDENTPFLRRTLFHSFRQGLSKLPDKRSEDFLFNIILKWNHWTLELMKILIGELLLNKSVEQNDNVRELTKRFILSKPIIAGIGRFGDPRLPANKHDWAGINEKAVSKFLAWLSQEDITFFFEHVLPDRIDKHDRKPFWLQYVSQVKFSRPFLILKDRDRLTREFRNKKSNFGYLTKGQASAFVLDFGPIMAIEFSTVGKCYLFDSKTKEEVLSQDEMWSDKMISAERFRRTDVSLEGGIRHDANGNWKDEIRKILARRGIRPD